MAIVEPVLVRVQRVVHLPELAMSRGGFGGLCGMFGVGMHFGQRKIPKDETKFISKPALNFVNYRSRFAAERALVVAVFEQRDRGCRGTANVIAGAYGQGEPALEICPHLPFSGCAARSSSAARMPSAPGF